MLRCVKVQLDTDVGPSGPRHPKGAGHNSSRAEKKVHDKRGHEGLGPRHATRNSPKAYSKAGGAGWSRRGKDHGSRNEEEVEQDAVRGPLLKPPVTVDNSFFLTHFSG